MYYFNYLFNQFHFLFIYLVCVSVIQLECRTTHSCTQNMREFRNKDSIYGGERTTRSLQFPTSRAPLQNIPAEKISNLLSKKKKQKKCHIVCIVCEGSRYVYIYIIFYIVFCLKYYDWYILHNFL